MLIIYRRHVYGMFALMVLMISVLEILSGQAHDSPQSAEWYNVDSKICYVVDDVYHECFEVNQ